MRLTVKYAVEPIYLKNEENNSRLLNGYIVSKCYVVNSEERHMVLFPYAVSTKSFALNKIRKPNQIIPDFNTTYVNNIYDTYLEAKVESNRKNKELNLTKDRAYLSFLQRQISENTQDLEINQRFYV